MSYNGWAYNDWSYNDQSYNDCQYNECSYGSYVDPYMLEEYSNGETYGEEQIDYSELKDMMQQILQIQQQTSLEINARFDRLDNKITQATKTQSQLEVATNIEESCDESVLSILTPSQDICDDIITIDENEEAIEEIARLLYGSNHEEFCDDIFTDAENEEAVEEIDRILYGSNHEEFSNLLLIHECESLNTVDCNLVKSASLEIDFIFPTNTFIRLGYSNIKDHLRKYFSFVETCFNKFVNTNFNKQLLLLVWTIVFLLAQFVYCENRRRKKGHLAQPFDSCD